jgi:hypothetical protein
MIFAGMILIVIVWCAVRRGVYFPFPYAVAGSVAWSIFSWQILIHQSIFGDRGELAGLALRNITFTQATLALCIPLALSAMVGVAHAVTNSIDFNDRFVDFAFVLLLGSMTGMLLAVPLFLLPLLKVRDNRK